MDISFWLPDLTVATVFDVGAHVGESTAFFLAAFPNARIWSFEPVFDTYQELLRNVGRSPRVTTAQIGFAHEAGEASVRSGETSNLSAIASDGDQTVRLTTVDRYCADHSIERIDFLKIDTEGYDLNVLHGAENMLSKGAVALVEVEAGANPDNTTHVPLEHFRQFLEGRGYRLFGFYDQAGEWPTNRPHLRRVNAVFISPGVILAGHPLRVRGALSTRLRSGLGLRWRSGWRAFGR